MYRKLLGFIVITCFMTGCTQLAFNERYSQVNWNKVIIAPFDGELASVAEEEFEHALAISSKLVVIPSSTVKESLKEYDLVELFENDPRKAMFKLADKMGAEGVIFARLKVINPEEKNSTGFVSHSASIFAKLVDVKTKTIVASSQHETTSAFFDGIVIVRDISQDSIEDFQEFFDKMNGK
jgi:hypothetical protein